MSQISDSNIESAWNEVSQASASSEHLSELMDRFGEAEPAMVEFIAEASSLWGSDAVDLVFHASLVIWRSVQESREGESRSFENVTPEKLIDCFEKNSQWMNEQDGEAVLLQKKLSDFSKFSEPELMRFSVELILEAHEDGLELEPEEQQQLLLVLKTLVDAFTL
jgi:hypothetical protein